MFQNTDPSNTFSDPKYRSITVAVLLSPLAVAVPLSHSQSLCSSAHSPSLCSPLMCSSTHSLSLSLKESHQPRPSSWRVWMDLYSFIKVFAQIYEVAEGRGGGGREKRFEDTQKEKRWAVTATVATVKRWVAMERSGGGGRERWWRKG